MRISDQFRAAKELAIHKNTVAALARTAEGMSVAPDSTEACSFCALGALKRVTASQMVWSSQAVMLHNCALDLYGTGIVDLNDVERDLEKVAGAYDEAIRRQEKLESSTCA